jgi:AcrR family transcriptional regulator
MVAIPTAHRIFAAARKLLDREGAEAVTMRRVADAVGITPMAIYRHYPDHSALLNSLADRGFEDLVGAVNARRLPVDLEARLLAMLDVHLDYALANPRLYELMFLKPRPGARKFPRDFKAGRSPTGNLAVAILQEAMDRGELRRDDPWEITFEMGALVEGLIMLYLGGRFDGSAAKFRALVRRSLRRYFHGIRA